LSRSNAQIAGNQCERSALAKLGGAGNPPGAPELAVHGGAHIVHRDSLEGACAKLRGGDDNMIDRTRVAEKACDTVVVGDIGWDRDCVQLFGHGAKPRSVARGDDNIGSLPLCHFSGREADAGRTADHNNLLALERHVSSLP